jgi:hypothetical protein
MRRVHDPERAAQERDKPLVSAAPVSHAARIIALQRTVGNHAVAAMLAREAAPKLQAAPGLAILDGIGTIPLESVSLGEVQKGGSREKPVTTREVNVMSKQGDHSSALQRASIDGKPFEVELLIGDKVRVKLHKAIISSFSMSGHGGDGPMDSWTLNAESIEFVTDER